LSARAAGVWLRSISFADGAARDGTVRLGPWRIAQAALYHGRAVKIVGVVKVTTGPLA
jgi:hypothetical protein